MAVLLQVRVNGAALQPDNKVVLVGLFNQDPDRYDMALARYLMGQDSPEPSRLLLSASPDVLWPPNNKMRQVSIAVSTEAGPAVSGCVISAVHSSEGSPLPGELDWQVTGPLTVNLKAARTGSGEGRTYTVTVTCTTHALSPVTASVTVLVLHDRSQAGSK